MSKNCTLSRSFFAFLFLVLLQQTTNAQLVYNEYFNNGDAPNTWAYSQTNNTYFWQYQTSTATPATTGVGGTGGFMWFNCSNFNTTTGYADMVSPAFSLEGRCAGVTATVSIYVYRNTGSNTNTYNGEGISININTTAAYGGTNLGFVPRRVSQAATGMTSGQATPGGNGWYQYVFTIPAALNTATNYLCIRAFSKGGDNISIDNLQISTYPLNPAVPNPGNSGPVCAGSTVDLYANGLAPGGQVATFSGTQTSGNGWGAITSISNTFSMDFWVNATATRSITPEANTSISGTSSQRYAIFPAHSGTNGGAGVSVGTNGIAVYEHGNNYLPSLLVYNTTLTGWNHVAVVYNNKTPSLYLNGVLVRVGLTSTMANIYPSLGTGGTTGTPANDYGAFAGQLDNVRIWNRALNYAEIGDLMFYENTAASGVTAGLLAQYKFNSSLADNQGVYSVWSPISSYANASYFTYTWTGPAGTTLPAASTNETQNATTSRPATNAPWNFSVTAKYGTCASTATVSQVTLPVAPGDPTQYGINQWNIYGYDGSNRDNLAATSYQGYYPLVANGPNYGFNTQSQWGQDFSPSSAPGWSGCPVPNDDHTFTVKRKGFPCGTYSVTVQNWDDDVILYVNGVNTYSALGWSGGMGCQNNNCNITVGTFTLDATSTIELRNKENGGTSYAAIDVVQMVPTTLSQNNDTRTCAVSGTAFSHFTTPTTNRLLLSINPNGNDLGLVTATTYLAGAPITIMPCTPNPQMPGAALARHYKVVPATQPASSVTVRLYLDNTELTTLMTAANGNTNPSDNVANLAALKMTKYNGTQEDDLFTNNCGTGTVALYTQSASGNATTLFTGFNANGRYLEFSIPSFSEFWFAGSINNSPLPVELVTYEAACHAGSVDLHWTTATENNTAYFAIEYSNDGMSWQEIGQVKAAGNSLQKKDYTCTDTQRPGTIRYYRLTEVDMDLTRKVLPVLDVQCGNDDALNSLSIYPNPASNALNLDLDLSADYGNGTLKWIDAMGRLVYTKALRLTAGHSSLRCNMDLPAGAYTLLLESEQLVLPAQKLLLQQ